MKELLFYKRSAVLESQ